MKIRTATARAHKKRLAIRVYTVYGITFDTDIITLARHGSRFHITHNNTPFLLKFLTGTDDKKAGEPEEDSCKVRIIFAVYSEDGQDGPLALLNLILRVRSELKKAGTIGGGQFALELPLEYIVYQDTTPPYYMGEMVTNWSMPVTQRDVAEILHNL